MKIAYWIVTILMALMILMASIPDVLMHEMAIGAMKFLGYPAYLLPFIGTLKILAVITILLPRLSILKEWAFAGLVFDVSGALYSLVCLGASLKDMSFAIIALILVIAAYILYRKRSSKIVTV
jgi:DoxX-like family